MVDCLRSVRMVMEKTSYEEIVKAAVALGDDTDTTAAVAGGLAGIVYGYKNIPKRWYDGLRGKDMVNPLVEGLMKLKHKR